MLNSGIYIQEEIMLKFIFEKLNRNKFVIKYFFVFFLFFSFLYAFDAQAFERNYVVPRFNVQIPGLDLKDFQITESAGMLSVPFLAVYIFTFYKYIVGIGLIATAIIIIYGGYLYLLGATGMQVQSGKQKIADALVGLVIILGTYAILMNVNPNTLQMQSLSMPEIVRDEFIIADHSLQTKPTVTDGIWGSGPIIEDPEVEPINPINMGKCRAIMALQKDLLIDNIRSSINGTDFASRVRQAAEYLNDCKISLGNCGNVALCTWMAAGINGEVKGGICTPAKNYYTGPTSGPSINNNDYMWAYGRRCAGSEDCLKKGDAARDGNPKRNIAPNLKQAQKWYDSFRPSGQCGITQKDAISLVRNYFRSNISGYPRSITDQLEAGDWFYTYGGNTECDGMHSQIFLGWHESKKGIAWIFDGDIKNNPRIRERCLTDQCGDYAPITKILKPRLDNPEVWMFANE